MEQLYLIEEFQQITTNQGCFSKTNLIISTKMNIQTNVRSYVVWAVARFGKRPLGN
jgi:hypothetical protein